MTEDQISARRLRQCYVIKVAGMTYNSLSLAAAELNVSPATVLNRCNSKLFKWSHWVVIRHPLYKQQHKPSRRVQVGRKIFASAAEAGRELKISRSLVLYRAKRMLEVDGLTYQFLPPTKEKR